MRKNMSVFMLNVRSVIYKVLLASGIISAIEIIYFTVYAEFFADSEYLLTEEIITKSHVNIFFFAGFLITGAILSSSFMNIGSKCSYTIMRLDVSEKRFFIINGLVNIIMLIIYFAVEITAGFIFIQLIRLFENGIYNSQSVFLAFLRSPYLQNIFPLTDPIRFIRNISIVISCGFCFAEASLINRRNKKPLLFIIAAVFPLMFMNSSIRDDFTYYPLTYFHDSVVIIASIIFTALAFNEVLRGSADE